MNLLKLNLHSHPRPCPYHHHHHHRRHHPKLRQSSRFLFFPSHEQSFKLSASCATPLYSFAKYAKTSKVKNAAISFSIDKNEEDETEDFEEYLAEDGEVYQKTLRLVECAMFAAVSGLAFLLSNSLAIEKYFACFFALPIVLSTMRWGIAAGRKTMVATTVLFVLSGPVKAITYLVRATGALGNVVIASYLIGENILALLLLNCGFFVFLLHLLYAIFFTRLGMKASLKLPKWLEAAI
ncbi:UNVERIFIED_CONTAM: hypothetical protein Sradi_0631400 [Sesamum radiatum]|uniref:Uncharacterized protein n=1 Tax=Sesamum radiatum TaxID=300843 RepID=A0AAW2VKJ2_SESRA